jgi:hypothetical protein
MYLRAWNGLKCCFFKLTMCKPAKGEEPRNHVVDGFLQAVLATGDDKVTPNVNSAFPPAPRSKREKVKNGKGKEVEGGAEAAEWNG